MQTDPGNKENTIEDCGYRLENRNFSSRCNSESLYFSRKRAHSVDPAGTRRGLFAVDIQIHNGRPGERSELPSCGWFSDAISCPSHHCRNLIYNAPCDFGRRASQSANPTFTCPAGCACLSPSSPSHTTLHQ